MRSTRHVGAVALGLVLGGAAGNLLDRLFREGSGFLGGGVVDFIDLQWWPIFNVADAAVTIGGLLLVFVVAPRAVTAVEAACPALSPASGSTGWSPCCRLHARRRRARSSPTGAVIVDGGSRPRVRSASAPAPRVGRVTGAA